MASQQGMVTLEVPGAQDTWIPSGETRDDVPVLVRVKAPARPNKRSGIDLVALLDVSGSMDSLTTKPGCWTRLDLVKSAMQLLVDKMLGPVDRLAVVAFNDSYRAIGGFMAMNDKGKKQTLKNVADLRAGGGTKFPPALQAACKLLKGRSEAERDERPGFIFLLSDGDDKSGTKPADMMPDNKEIKKYPVHTFGMCQECNPAKMRGIAKATGGAFHPVNDNLSNIAQALCTFAEGIKSVVAVATKVTLKVPKDARARGAQIKAVDHPGYNHGGGVVDIGVMYAYEVKSFIVHLSLPGGMQPGPKIQEVEEGGKQEDDKTENGPVEIAATGARGAGEEADSGKLEEDEPEPLAEKMLGKPTKKKPVVVQKEEEAVLQVEGEYRPPGRCSATKLEMAPKTVYVTWYNKEPAGPCVRPPILMESYHRLLIVEWVRYRLVAEVSKAVDGIEPKELDRCIEETPLKSYLSGKSTDEEVDKLLQLEGLYDKHATKDEKVVWKVCAMSALKKQGEHVKKAKELLAAAVQEEKKLCYGAQYLHSWLASQEMQQMATMAGGGKVVVFYEKQYIQHVVIQVVQEALVLMDGPPAAWGSQPAQEQEEVVDPCKCVDFGRIDKRLGIWCKAKRDLFQQSSSDEDANSCELTAVYRDASLEVINRAMHHDIYLALVHASNMKKCYCAVNKKPNKQEPQPHALQAPLPAVTKPAPAGSSAADHPPAAKDVVE